MERPPRPESDLALRVFLEGRRRGRKAAGCMQPLTANSSLRIALPVLQTEEDLTSVGLNEQRRERSKSESIMWPSSRTRMFSGFKSLYTTPNMCRYSRASNTSEV